MTNDIDLSVRLGPLTLKNPFIVGSGPTMKSVDQVRAAEDAGWAAVSLKLTFDPAPYVNLPPRYRWLRRLRMHVFTAETRLTPSQGLKLIEEARAATSDIVILPNIAHDGGDTEGWSRLAKRFENAGAQALELNLCCPNMSYNISTSGAPTVKATGASLGQDIARIPAVVRAVVETVKVPVIVKLTPEGGRIAHAAQAAIQAGAAAAGSTANRLGIPDIDIRNPMSTIYRLQEGITLGCLSGPWIRPLALRDTCEIRRLLGVGASVIGSGGVSDLQSAVQQIMVGADALWICTETILRGFAWMKELLEELRAYMREMGWSRIRDFRDMLMPNIKSAADLVTRDGHAVVDTDLCTMCGSCWSIGQCRAIAHANGCTTIDPAMCQGCSTCVDVCARQAISMTP